MRRHLIKTFVQILCQFLLLWGYVLPICSQQVQVRDDEKKLYNERAESVIKNFFSSLETFRELNMDAGILLEIQRNCLWNGSSNTARFFEDFTQAGHGKAYKQSNVRDYLRNYCYTFDQSSNVSITVDNFQYGDLCREGNNYYMKVRFIRNLETVDKIYRYPLEAVCNFVPGIRNVNNGGLQSIDKRNSDYLADSGESTKATTRSAGNPTVTAPVTLNGSNNTSGGKNNAETSRTTMNEEEKKLFQQGKQHYMADRYVQAEQCFKQLSSYPEVYFYLGYVYSYPEATKQASLGFYYTSKAASIGNVYAQNNIGSMYENGIYVRMDLRKAYEWYVTAAQSRNAKAMSNVGRFCYYGFYVKQDYNIAYEWFVASYNIVKDSFTAMMLGECYYYGRGCAQNYTKAVEFLEYAQSKGKENTQLLQQARQKKQAQTSSESSSGSAYTRAYNKAKAQTSGKVSGVVLDRKGDSIVGANVMVAGTTIGTITDLDGQFSLSNVPENAMLKIAYIGFRTVTIKAAPQLTITLRE